MSTSVSYVAGAELPPMIVQLLGTDGTSVIDLTGYTFTLKLGLDTTTTALTKTTNISGGADGATVHWQAGELDIAAGTYLGELTATSGGLDYRRQFTMTIEPRLA